MPVDRLPGAVALGVLILLSGAVETGAQQSDRYPIVPWPQKVEAREGSFSVTDQTRVALSDPADTRLRAVAEQWASRVRLASALALPTVSGPARSAQDDTVAFVLDPDIGLDDEGYRLEVTTAGVTVTAATHAGLFYGTQTLRQLSPTGIDRGGVVPSDEPPPVEIPAVTIEDAPRFQYRGLHLDVVRHFYPVQFVKRYLDLMALYKLNRFHWHLTDDQGWRVAIEQYPKLTEVGAWRDQTLVGHYRNRPHRFDGQRYGGFYTKQEIREVVEHAAELYITVIPEIELPGHASAALAAYPELGCTDGPFEVEGKWGVFEDIFCPKEETFTFLENVLTEVLELFPSELIHIGGDEAPKARWETSELAQEVMRREGLADEHELQSYFIRRIERFLNEHGRRLVGWDEIVEGGLSPTATLMFWRNWSEEALHQAAEQGNDLIMTPNQTLYLDHYQGDPGTEPLAIGGLTTLEEVYGYEPVPESYTASQAEHVLGAQANVWTEYIKTPQHVEYMVYPRVLALAEVVWSEKEARDWSSFEGRLPAQLDRLQVLGVNYRSSR